MPCEIDIGTWTHFCPLNGGLLSDIPYLLAVGTNDPLEYALTMVGLRAFSNIKPVVNLLRAWGYTDKELEPLRRLWQEEQEAPLDNALEISSEVQAFLVRRASENPPISNWDGYGY